MEKVEKYVWKECTASARIHQIFTSSFSGIIIVTWLCKDQNVGAQLVSRSDDRSWSLTWRTWRVNAPRQANAISFQSTWRLNLNALDGFACVNNRLHIWCPGHKLVITPRFALMLLTIVNKAINQEQEGKYIRGLLNGCWFGCTACCSRDSTPWTSISANSTNVINLPASSFQMWYFPCLFRCSQK